jgi:hypothetical protein
MNKTAKILLTIAIILAVGAVAKHFNTQNHHDMALEYCGSEDNIEHVDSKGFTCKTPRKPQ